jgi:hypothetical protein
MLLTQRDEMRSQGVGRGRGWVPAPHHGGSKGIGVARPLRAAGWRATEEEARHPRTAAQDVSVPSDMDATVTLVEGIVPAESQARVASALAGQVKGHLPTGASSAPPLDAPWWIDSR